ncbi:MAG: PLP-dependent aminotransferase family protein [Nitrospirota bacterium]
MMYSERIAGVRSSAIRDILKLTTRPGMISFAGGLPAPELFPMEEIARAAQNVFSKYGPSSLQYSITEGIKPLREKIAKKVYDGQGIGVENIIITQGSQQGLDLISKLLIDKGAVVLTENPSYLGALQSFRLFQADIVSIPSDEKGIQVKKLREALNSVKPAFIYLMPNFQNPTGVTLSMERRTELIELMRDRDVLIVEDDPYGELIFEGKSLPTLFSLARGKDIVYVSSFSKTIVPGFRVAYIAADAEIAGKLALVKQGTDLHTNTLGQHVVNEYLESGNHRKHLDMVRQTYKTRRDLMLSAMEKHFPKSARWNKPAGGMFIWATLADDGTDSKDILLRCIEKDVAFVPGREFFPDGSGGNTMRLNFSNAAPDDIEKGIKRIGEVLAGMGSEKRE